MRKRDKRGWIVNKPVGKYVFNKHKTVELNSKQFSLNN